MHMNKAKAITVFMCCLLLPACAKQALTPSSGHLQDTLRATGNIPKPVQQAMPLPQPKASPKVELYSVTVNNVPVQELLFALARDAKVNIDIHQGIEGNVTLNALNQTLPQLLNRIARQVDLRYELDGPNLAVMPDTPFLRSYKVDYLNMSRDASSSVNIATQIATTGSGAGSSSSGSSGGGGNNSATSVTNTSNNRFWVTLVQNIKDLLRETDKVIPDEATGQAPEPAPAASTAAPRPTGSGGGRTAAAAADMASASNQNTGQPASAAQAPAPRRVTYREAASVIANPENGLISVRATGRQHEKVQEFIDQIMVSARRQVMIEATVVEVRLSDQYQQGINWTQIRNNPAKGFNLKQQEIDVMPSGISTGRSPGLLTLGYLDQTSPLGNISASIQLLESFGDVKVLSSPKISVLNNQTALLKVVDNKVYFTIDVTVTPGESGSAPVVVYTSAINTVPVGFVMGVTPQIDETDTVTFNVRPTISRITGYVNDPNPSLATANVVSRIPEIQTREMESILRVNNGQTAIMGGLMQDEISNYKDAVPGLSSLPFVGDVFGLRNETSRKSELVVFLKPVVVKSASLDGDFKAYRNFLPDKDAFSRQESGTTLNHLFKKPGSETVTP